MAKRRRVHHSKPSGARTIVTFRMAPHELKQLDRIAAELGAGGRSEFIRSVLVMTMAAWGKHGDRVKKMQQAFLDTFSEVIADETREGEGVTQQQP